MRSVRGKAQHAGPSTWIISWSGEERCNFGGVLQLANEVLGTHERLALAVHDKYQPWWERAVADLPLENVAEQPIDRGSAAGILLAFLRTFRRHPFAQLVLVPSGVGFTAEHIDAALALASGATHDAGRVLLVPPPDVRSTGGARLATAAGRSLAITSSNTLLRLFQRTQPELLQTFLQNLSGPALFDPIALERFYPFLPLVDFGRDVLAEDPDLLQIVDLASDELERFERASSTRPIVRLLAQLEA